MIFAKSLNPTQRRIQGGGIMGAEPHPEPVKSMDFRVFFQTPTVAGPPPRKEKSLSPLD